MSVLAAIGRYEVASYVAALFDVYIFLIFAYVVSSLFFGLGGRAPYAPWLSAVLGFLRDVCEPYLRIFRRLLPLAGPLDLSPIVGILLLYIVRGIVVRLIAG